MCRYLQHGPALCSPHAYSLAGMAFGRKGLQQHSEKTQPVSLLLLDLSYFSMTVLYLAWYRKGGHALVEDLLPYPFARVLELSKVVTCTYHHEAGFLAVAEMVLSYWDTKTSR